MAGLYFPDISAFESMHSQYKEYFDSPAVSAVKAMQAQHEEWLSKTASVASVLESINISAAKALESAIARANSIAEMYAPVNDLVEKYAVMSESFARVDISDWKNIDEDSFTGKSWLDWEASPTLELEEDEQKHLKSGLTVYLSQ